MSLCVPMIISISPLDNLTSDSACSFLDLKREISAILIGESEKRSIKLL